MSDKCHFEVNIIYNQKIVSFFNIAKKTINCYSVIIII